MAILPAEEGEQFLQDMIHGRNGAPKPDSWSYSTVINSWFRSGAPRAAERAEAILRQRELASENDARLALSTVDYNMVLKLWVNTNTSQGIERAEMLLREMQENYLEGRRSVQPDGLTYSTMIRGYAQMRDGSDECFGRASRLLTEMIAANCVNSAAFAHMISICDRYLNTSDPRRLTLLQKLMNECKKHGLVSSSVLEVFRRAVPPNLFDKMLGPIGKENGDRIELEDLPQEWRKEVRIGDKTSNKRQL
jgi:hypothetical protein